MLLIPHSRTLPLSPSLFLSSPLSRSPSLPFSRSYFFSAGTTPSFTSHNYRIIENGSSLPIHQEFLGQKKKISVLSAREAFRDYT